MTEETGGYGPPELEGYSVQPVRPPDHPGLAGPGGTPEADPARAPVQITVYGRNLISRAMMPVFTVGGRYVARYSTARDGRSAVLFLDEMPEDGAEIRVGYDRDSVAVLPERFSRSKAFGHEPPDGPGD